MPRYSSNNTMGGSQQAIASAYKTLISVTALTGATTLRRGWIDEVIVGADGTLNGTNCQVIWDFSKMTAAGTGTAQAPVSPEAGDAAALLVYTMNYTAEPTITGASTLLGFPTNQQQSQRWFANQAPNQTQALVIPAITVNGIAGRCKSPAGYTGTAQLQLYCIE